MFGPLFVKLGLQDLGSPLPGEPGLLQAQLAHVHVVLPGHQEYRSPPGVELHLPGDPGSVKVSKPPAPASLVCRVVDAHLGPAVRSDKRNAEIPVITIRYRLLQTGHAWLVSLLQNTGGSSDRLVESCIFLLVLCLPGVIDLQTAVEFLPTCLWNIKIQC